MMKCETDYRPFIDPSIDTNKSFKSETVWYHPFCAFTNPHVRIHNLTSMQGLRLMKDVTNFTYPKFTCKACNVDDFCYFLWGNKDISYHPLCAWLNGYRFEVLSVPSLSIPIAPL